MRGESRSGGAPHTGPVLAEGGAQLAQATGQGCVDVPQPGEGWVPRKERQDVRTSASPPQCSFLPPHPLSSRSREQESVFCFGINWAGCGKVGSRLPQLSGSASFLGWSTVVTELPLPHFAVPPPQLHLPPLVLALPHPLAQPGESLPWKDSQMGSILLFPGWVLEKHSGITDEEMKAEGGGQGLPGPSW